MKEVKPRSKRLLFLAAGVLLLAGFLVSRFVCVGAWIRYGVVVPTCPDGRLRQTLAVDCRNLRRGAEGTARVEAFARYTTASPDEEKLTTLRRYEASLALVKEKGEEIPLPPVRGWQTANDARTGAIVLPRDLPDGDYRLRARVRSPLGEDQLDVPLAVYAPARIHVITDRPLYEPGNTVQFRAVVLRASDLAPVDGRPGRWIVRDPEGTTVLEEKAPAGLFGVVSGSFPLDGAAPPGEWKVSWSSGGADDTVAFRVEPFTLPRFHVEAAPAKPFYRAGDHPVVKGKVLYTSGAPVRGAALEIDWSVSDGEWPPPPDWEQGGLPKRASTDASGAFALTLPVVPKDLRGRVTLSARLAATDAAGDRVGGGVSVLLSEHALQLSAVTELEQGLVEGFNNRVYLRATSAAGAVLADTELVVKRAWEPNDPGVTAVTDEDGVAALQLDPGPPVNVVVPAMPVRPEPRPPAVTRGNARELLTGGAPPLADQLALDRLNGALGPCGRFVADESESATVGLRVNAAGAVVATASDGRALPACLAAALRGRKLSPGHERVYQIEYTLTSDLPKLEVGVNGAPRPLAGLEAALRAQALDARTCLPRKSKSGPLPHVLLWSARPAQKSLSFSWAPDPEKSEEPVPAAVAACIERKVRPPAWASLQRSESREERDAEGELLGMARFSVQSLDEEEEGSAEATTLLGYELSVTARARGKKEELGSSPLILRPGQVPPIRLRASPVLAQPGGEIEVAIVRGPSFTGALPKTLVMTHLHGSLEAKVDEESRTARFKLPADAKGWFEVKWASGRALVYVRPPSELAVSIRPGAERYAPGKMAELTIRTTAGKRGTSAAVGLFGVDASLGDLAPLPGPNDMARIRPHAQMAAPAFEVLDVSALELGRLRGTNAATATVLRVTALPEAPAVEGVLSASARPPFDAVAALTDSFYNVLGELHARVRHWEETAPKGQQMKPAQMAKLWTEAVDACEKRKEPVADAYGRRLRLSRLPADLLALTDPQMVVVSGTRRPEDVESWSAWVQREKP